MDYSHPSLRIFERLGNLFGYPTQSRRLQTAYQLLDAYKALSVDRILAQLDDAAFSQQVLPYSLGMPKRNKAEFTGHAKGVTSVFKEFRMEPQQVFEDEVQNAVIIQAKMIGELTQDRGPWENECIMIMKFTPDGRQIISHEEFVDSAKAKLMKERLAPKDFGAK